MEMNVGLLKRELEGLPDSTPVFVACQGACNFDFKTGAPLPKTDTFAIQHDGKLFLTDEWCVPDGQGGTL